MNERDVCAAVVSWNRRDDTLRCLASLAGARGVGPVVVVDNGSADGTVAAVRRERPGVAVLEPGRNLGFAGGANLAARHFLHETSCPYLLVMNNDLTVAPECVSLLVEAAEGAADIGVAAPKIYYADRKDRIWYAGGRIDWKKGTCEHYGMGTIDRGLHDRPRDVTFACGGLFLVKREVVSKTGLFDERYFMFEEDVELSARVTRAGYRIRYVPSAAAWHAVGSAAASRGDAFIWYYLVRNRLYTMRSHGLRRHRLLFGLYFPAMCTWKSLFFAAKGNTSVARAIARGIRDYRQGVVGEGFVEHAR